MLDRKGRSAAAAALSAPAPDRPGRLPRLSRERNGSARRATSGRGVFPVCAGNGGAGSLRPGPARACRRYPARPDAPEDIAARLRHTQTTAQIQGAGSAGTASTQSSVAAMRATSRPPVRGCNGTGSPRRRSAPVGTPAARRPYRRIRCSEHHSVCGRFVAVRGLARRQSRRAALPPIRRAICRTSVSTSQGERQAGDPGAPARRHRASPARRGFEVSDSGGDMVPAVAGGMRRTRLMIALRVIVVQGGGDVSPCVVNE